ncbi:MAG: cation-translocating P-type ATPase [Nitrospinae bacterium]|nr:cation-translocating P-type ATPase [Nitrospinota bacterium]
MARAGLDFEHQNGLSDEEAARRLAEEGFNELPSAKPKSAFAIAFDVIREPMFLLLVACGVIYLMLGDTEEALLLLGFVFVVMFITFYQERKTERALEALRDLSSPRALVIRGGREVRIPGRDVVRGDIMVLEEGDRVPADAELLSCVSLMTDESLLTGEPVPVRKSALEGEPPPARPGGDDLPFVFSGTLVVRGQGIARARATGGSTEIGKIGKALESLIPEDTHLQKESRTVVRVFTTAGLGLLAIIVGVFGFVRGDWLNGLLAGLTVAMSILPEEIPVILTVFLALGAWRISHKRVLTRSVPALEMLGAVTVLCVDKTGTLTQNRMTAARLYAEGRFHDVDPQTPGALPEHFHRLAEYSMLAGKKDPFDPMEKALVEMGDRYLHGSEHVHEERELVREYPLTKKFLAFTHIWKKEGGESLLVATKGAPETVADLCHLPAGSRRKVLESAEAMAADGLRVLGVASASLPTPEQLPESQHDFSLEFIGLIGLSDPVRPGVAESLSECKSAGIRVVMITGDYPRTAKSVAERIGLESSGGCITGSELEAMTDAELKEKIGRVNVFARVQPDQKLRIVGALKANGEVVGMTGDGVNDAPALKAAHIGIAMGQRGTDVAREAAALVLTDDDFSSIVSAVRLGRRIFDNIKKAIAYTIGIHIPIAGISLVPVLVGWPLVLLPVHIAFLELIIDPACSVVFEAEEEEKGIMRKPPRDPSRPLFSREMVTISVLLGAGVFVIVFAVFAVAMLRGQGVNDARALTFTTLIVSNIGLILTNRSWTEGILTTLKRPNAALWWLIGGAVVFISLVLYVPFLRQLFRFTSLHPVDIAICLVAGMLGVAWFELLKFLRRGGANRGAVR